MESLKSTDSTTELIAKRPIIVETALLNRSLRYEQNE